MRETPEGTLSGQGLVQARDNQTDDRVAADGERVGRRARLAETIDFQRIGDIRKRALQENHLSWVTGRQVELDLLRTGSRVGADDCFTQGSGAAVVLVGDGDDLRVRNGRLKGSHVELGTDQANTGGAVQILGWHRQLILPCLHRGLTGVDRWRYRRGLAQMKVAAADELRIGTNQITR